MIYAEYERINAVRWSFLKAMRVSPRQYRYELDKVRPDAAHYRVGRAAHAFLLEQETFLEFYVCYTGGQRRGKAWEAFQEEHAGKCILSEAEWKIALGSAAAVLDHPVASQYLAVGFREATITWTDGETGLACKGRVDHCGTHLVDVKTTATIEPRMFANAVARYGYHAQLAWYLDGLRTNGIEVHDTPILVAVQSSPPHDVVTYHLPDHVVQAGRDEYRKLLVKVAECEASGDWPGIAPEELEMVLPEWGYQIDDEPLALTIGGAPLGGL
jgi:exodeoxyribonuclease VIII